MHKVSNRKITGAHNELSGLAILLNFNIMFSQNGCAHNNAWFIVTLDVVEIVLKHTLTNVFKYISLHSKHRLEWCTIKIAERMGI